MDWIEQLILEVPDSFGPLLVKAWSLTEADDWEGAEEALKLALQRAPHNEDVLLFYTSELGRQGKMEELINLIAQEPEPRPIALVINLALAYIRLGRMAEAEKILKKPLEDPELSLDDQQKLRALLSEMEKRD